MLTDYNSEADLQFGLIWTSKRRFLYFHGEFECSLTDPNMKYFKLLDDHRIRSKVIETAVTNPIIRSIRSYF